MLRRESSRSEREGEATAIAVLSETPPILHPVADDQLRLMFVCCHPALPREAHVELTLRLVCGLTVAEIGRALLRGEEAVAKRIQRAKAKLRDARIPLELPSSDLLDQRLPSVLDCTYLTFTEGYAATAGDQLIRHELCDEAIRLARLLAELLPSTAGPQALLALLLLQDARREARLDERGDVVVLAEQDRRRWNRSMIDEGERWLALASAHPTVSAPEAAYLFQAGIAAEHATAPTWEETDWPSIVVLYDRLADLTDSPAVLVNRAVAVSFADGPAAARSILTDLAADPRLARSHRLAVARADVEHRLGDVERARAAYREALALDPTDPERRLVERRLADL